MPPRKRLAPTSNAADYRHDETRLNNPPDGIADLHLVAPGRKRFKTSKASHVFSVFGKPDVQLSPPGPEDYTITVKGVDVYAPNTDEFDASSADQVAAWFLDTDYDGATFLVRQAYFLAQVPNPWKKLSKVLKGSIAPDQFAALQRTTSLPFKAGKHKRCAVKVIDMRGNEVMTVIKVH